jgi:hypothetical protein
MKIRFSFYGWMHPFVLWRAYCFSTRTHFLACHTKCAIAWTTILRKQESGVGGGGWWLGLHVILIWSHCNFSYGAVSKSTITHCMDVRALQWYLRKTLWANVSKRFLSRTPPFDVTAKDSSELEEVTLSTACKEIFITTWVPITSTICHNRNTKFKIKSQQLQKFDSPFIAITNDKGDIKRKLTESTHERTSISYP